MISMDSERLSVKIQAILFTLDFLPYTLYFTLSPSHTSLHNRI